jgi:hypothetical protein
MISANFAQSNQQTSNLGVTVTPFVEWYDDWGNFIGRVFARTTSTSGGTPNSYAYDSFSTGRGTPLAGRALDAGGLTWNVLFGGWLLDGAGNTYATPAGNYTIATVPAPLSGVQAVTFTESPQSGTDTGLIFWYQSITSYWHAGTQGLYYKGSSGWTLVATYPHAFQPGDRIYVTTSQATPSIVVYRNVMSAYNATTGNGVMATLVGSGAMPSGSAPGSGATVYSGIASEAV